MTSSKQLIVIMKSIRTYVLIAECPTNCADCTAVGTLTCTDCNSGYALAGDKLSCIGKSHRSLLNVLLLSSVLFSWNFKVEV